MEVTCQLLLVKSLLKGWNCFTNRAKAFSRYLRAGRGAWGCSTGYTEPLDGNKRDVRLCN